MPARIYYWCPSLNRETKLADIGFKGGKNCMQITSTHSITVKILEGQPEWKDEYSVAIPKLAYPIKSLKFSIFLQTGILPSNQVIQKTLASPELSDDDELPFNYPGSDIFLTIST